MELLFYTLPTDVSRHVVHKQLVTLDTPCLFPLLTLERMRKYDEPVVHTNENRSQMAPKKCIMAQCEYEELTSKLNHKHIKTPQQQGTSLTCPCTEHLFGTVQDMPTHTTHSKFSTVT